MKHKAMKAETPKHLPSNQPTRSYLNLSTSLNLSASDSCESKRCDERLRSADREGFTRRIAAEAAVLLLVTGKVVEVDPMGQLGDVLLGLGLFFRLSRLIIGLSAFTLACVAARLVSRGCYG